MRRPTEKLPARFRINKGNPRLPNAEDFGDLDLSHATVLKDCVDFQGKLHLEKFVFRIAKAELRKGVSAAPGYPSNVVAFFLCFVKDSHVKQRRGLITLWVKVPAGGCQCPTEIPWWKSYLRSCLICFVLPS